LELIMYPPELLRTFLAVAQSLSFTQAGARLGLRQPTVSQHIRKLEDLVGRSLFVRDTRTVALTADGEAMAGFARSILAANEEATSYFTGSGLTGRLRFGVTDDLALTQVPRILRDFQQSYPKLALELTVDQSNSLHRRLETGHLDVAFVKRHAGEGTEGQLVSRERMVWGSVVGARIDPDRPLPLVVYQAPSLSRSLAVAALEKAGRAHRITCTVRGVNGVLAAVRAGLGIATFARGLLPGDMIEVARSHQLPDVGEMDLVLLRNPRSAKEPVAALTEAILSGKHPTRPVQ
jgi:DNA-binding transcriptional LysR family regulator